jgi:2-methylcitrate dehydratase PrpD
MSHSVDICGRFALETRLEDMPKAAVEAAKTFILDTIGVGIAGSTAPYAADVLAAARGWGKGSDVTIWGVGEKLPALSGALVNAYQIHCQEFDSVHDAAVVHAMATIFSAVTSHAERKGGITGRELIEAVAIGVDIAVLLGLASKSAIRFFRPANAGIMGATAALARLEGFTLETFKNAWGIALGLVSGTMQSHVEGKPVLALQIGFASRGALTAIDLAGTGIPGPHDVLEGPFGYLKLIEGEYDLSPFLPALGETWRIAEVSHKPYPTGRAAQGGISGLFTLKKLHRFGAEDVERVRLFVPPLTHRLIGRPILPDLQANYARLCFQYSGAVALLRDIVDVPDFRPAALADARAHALAQRIEVIVDGNPDVNALEPQKLEVTLKDGRTFALDLPRVLGSPENPLTRDEHLEKFRRCWTYSAKPLAEDGAEGMIALIDRLETVANTNEIVARLTPR